MADFVAVLKKTIEGLNANTPEMRERVYRKARDTVAAKLAAINPPPSQIVVDRQRKALEDAISAVEASYAGTRAEDDFDSVLADLEKKPVPAVAPVAPEHGPTAPAAAMQEGSESSADPATEPDWHSGDELKPVEPRPRAVPPLSEPLAGDAPAETPGSGRRRVSGGVIAALVVLIVVVAAGYGIWLNRGDFGSMPGFGDAQVTEQQETAAGEQAAEVPAEQEPEQPAEQVASAPETVPQEQAAAPEEPAEKFTQRLMPDGREIDAGPAGGEPGIGEGTSLAQASEAAPAGTETQPAQDASGAQPAPPENAGGDQPVPVGQRAIFYEERTGSAAGTADNGSTIWSLVQESPGNDLPPEPAIRAEVTIPGKNVQLKMTIRRNADQTLPASHIIEMIFLGNFEGGGIENVLRIALKNSEAAPGNPLIGIPAKIADGYFLVALSDSAAERETNLQLLLRQSWIDIPIVYRSGRRALVTMEKGVPGDKVFQEAIQAWRNASSG